ncbi:hypothetical protein MU1_49770 [Paenibacillus glycanilyticus]|uniref:Uncharacterized protein n=1 Tax=Paenibacillus glycanilyticus TaxID=126569 RepID=A0ABQ6GMR4_9BACL|nr:hypothetical protein MU1_49770 [Paenibacillus glycanilyticus]
MFDCSDQGLMTDNLLIMNISLCYTANNKLCARALVDLGPKLVLFTSKVRIQKEEISGTLNLFLLRGGQE